MLRTTVTACCRRHFIFNKFLHLCTTVLNGSTLADNFDTNSSTLSHVQVPAHARFYTLKALDSGSILIIIEGSGTLDNVSLDTPLDMCQGMVLFIAAFNECSLSTYPSCGASPPVPKDVIMYRAYCSL